MNFNKYKLVAFLAIITFIAYFSFTFYVSFIHKGDFSKFSWFIINGTSYYHDISFLDKNYTVSNLDSDDICFTWKFTKSSKRDIFGVIEKKFRDAGYSKADLDTQNNYWNAKFKSKANCVHVNVKSNGDNITLRIYKNPKLKL